MDKKSGTALLTLLTLDNSRGIHFFPQTKSLTVKGHGASKRIGRIEVG